MLLYLDYICCSKAGNCHWGSLALKSLVFLNQLSSITAMSLL